MNVSRIQSTSRVVLVSTSRLSTVKALIEPSKQLYEYGSDTCSEPNHTTSQLRETPSSVCHAAVIQCTHREKLASITQLPAAAILKRPSQAASASRFFVTMHCNAQTCPRMQERPWEQLAWVCDLSRGITERRGSDDRAHPGLPFACRTGKVNITSGGGGVVSSAIVLLFPPFPATSPRPKLPIPLQGVVSTPCARLVVFFIQCSDKKAEKSESGG